MKRFFLWAMVFVLAMGSVPALAQEGVLLCETFDGYITNSMQTLLTHKGDVNARVVEAQSGNKAFLLPSQVENNELSGPITVTGNEITFSVKVKFEDVNSAMAIGFSDGSNQKFFPVNISEAGEITAENGKRLGGAVVGKWIQFDIGYNMVEKRYNVSIDGKSKLYYSMYTGSCTMPTSILITTSVGEVPSRVLVDDVFVYDGMEVRSDITGAAYTPQSQEYVEVEVDTTPGEAVYLNNAFDRAAAAMQGITADAKGNTIAYAQEEDGNGYLLMDKTLDATDPLFDVTFNTGVGKYLVFQVDLSSEKLGATTQLFSLRDDMRNFSYTFRVLPSGDVTTHRGDKVAKIKKGQYVNVAAAYNLRNKVFDVYVDGEKVLEQVPMSNQDFGTLASSRTQMLPSQGNGQLMIDNLKIYEGAEPRDLEALEITDDFTVLPDSSADIQKLRGTVALQLGGEFIFVNTEKQKMDVRPYLVNDRTMVPVRAVAEAFGLQAGWDEATETITLGDSITMQIGSPTMTVSGREVALDAAPELKDGRTFLPLRALAEEALGKQVFYDELGLIVISDSPFQYADDRETLKSLSTYVFSVRPSAEEIAQLFSQAGYENVHPRLHANAQDFARLRELSQTNERIKTWTRNAIATADRLLTQEPLEYEIPDGLRLLDTSRAVQDRLINLGYAYQITGDQKYAQRAWKEMEKVASYPDWNPKHFLDTAEMTYGVAVGYDWCYDALTPEQRETIENAIVNFGLEEGKRQYMGSPTGTNFVFQDMNWNVVCNGGLSAGALAIMEAAPEIARYTLRCATRSMDYMITEFAPDGAWVEGPGYWGYTLKFFCLWMDCMKYPLGTDFGMPYYPGIDKTAQFIFSMDGNCGCNNFHDGGSGHCVTEEVMWLGRYFGDEGPTAAYLSSMDAFNIAGGALECLYYDTNVTSTEVNMPLDITTSVTETGSMRSSWTDKNGMWLSFSGGENQVNHYHLDEGAFVLDMMGERWAMDLGSDNLTYTNNFAGPRNYVYRIRPEGHNTIVINPSSEPGQEMTANCPIIASESKEKGAYQVLDMTSAYYNQADSVIRGYMLTDDRRTAVIRDEIALKEESTVYWFMHTTADIEITSSDTAILTIEGKKMQLKMACEGATAKLTQMDAVPLPTTISLDGEAVNTGVRKIAITMEGSGDVALSVRLTPAEEYSAQLPFTCEKIENWSIPDGAITPIPEAKGIYVNGELISGFSPSQPAYTVKTSLDSVPQVTIDAGEYQVETLSEAADFDSITSFKVSGADGKYRVYTVGFKKLEQLDSVQGYQRLTPRELYASDNPEPENMDVNASDGSYDTRWSADGTQTLTYDFGETITMEAFAVSTMNGKVRTYSFDIEVSDDGTNFTTIYSGQTAGGTDELELFTIEPVQTRYVRYHGYGNSENSWNSITEFAVLGQ